MTDVDVSQEQLVKTAIFWLKKEKESGLPTVMKVRVQIELKELKPEIRKLAEKAIANEPRSVPTPPPPSGESERVIAKEPRNQDTIDKYTQIGKAKKISESIAGAAKHTMKEGDLTLLPSKMKAVAPEGKKSSWDDARQMVKDAGSWKEVKKLYLSNEPTMRRLLQFRVEEVGRIYQMVRDQMWNDNTDARDKWEEVRKTEQYKNLSPEEKEELAKGVFQLNDLQFAMMGSTDLTSDYDVSFDHNANKPWVGTQAVQIFNQKFRDIWHKEAGTVFDTNVYTQGFMPSDMSNIPAGVERSFKGRLENVDKMLKAETNEGKKEELALLKAKLEDQAKTAAWVRESMAKGTVDKRSEKRVLDEKSKAAVFQIEDLMSLVKMRKFMDSSEWFEYSEKLLEGLPEDGEAWAAAKSVLKKADTTFLMLDQQLKERMNQLEQGREDVDEDDLELEASNRLYEEYLEQAGEIVAENEGILTGPAISDWTEKQSTALYFANEAYHTSGPVESTVIGQQMGIPMKQVAEQLLQAINEQTGFVIEQHEHAYDDKGLFKQGRFLWKSAKYVDRICSIIDQIKKDLGPEAVKNPKHFSELKPLSAKLLAIKKTTDPDETKDKKSLEALPRGDINIRKMVEELNTDVNQQLRLWKPEAPVDDK